MAATLLAEESRKDLLMLSSDAARKMRETVSRDAALRRLADAALEKGPWSVTAHRPKGIDVPDHEYYSEGPYWWPDPKNPDGPYIRKDGERNPARFDDNHRDLGAMCTAALALGIGAYFFGDDRYVAHARKILSAWFVDPGTRMNPNLEYGQAVRGVNTGRGTGIIDPVSLIHATQGIMLLEAAGKLDAALSSGLRRWLTDYLHWMTTSDKGLDEKKSGNNHATWWTAQAAAYAAYLNDAAAQQMAWDHYRNVLLRQIQPDGSCPREEARTRSLSYAAYNLDAFSVLCRVAEVAGVDLWRFHTPQGVGVDTAVAYLTPFIGEPKSWRKQQIVPFDSAGIVFPALAGQGLRNAELLRIYRGLPRANTPWVQWIDLIVKQ